ncbi:MAG: NAD+ synthase [Candidatus Omnitrophica bacterium CG07_land_8_20_14_0_80_50_8]|nr:MAG: NAD+ synthase [Candidatus Omnitrophica bacterium CG07_land_8_20_14_0_80_50_8]
MKTPRLKILIAQINTTVGDLEGNRDKIIAALRFAKESHADLVTFPELAINGYPPEDILHKDYFVLDNLNILKTLVSQTKGIAAIIGFVDRDKKKRLYNAAALIVNQKIRAIYHKIHLPNYGVFDERRYFTPGTVPVIMDLGRFSLSVTICEDIWRKDSYVYQRGYRGKASLLVNISASPYHTHKQTERQKLIKNLAVKTRSTVIYHNLVGGQDELVFDGGSMAVNASGRTLGEAKRFMEDFLTIDLGSQKPARLPTPLGHQAEVYQALVLGTHDYIQKNNFKKVLVGLSGGIDSALVACIAADALGPKNVVAVTMPSPYTSQETYQDAKLLAKNLSIQCLKFRIHKIFKQYLTAFKGVFSGHPPDTTEENLQARIRGNVLMALSNKFGHLVLTTGNKSEMATGYCTLYGDMAGGFAVIKDVPKTLIFGLARYRNSLGASPVIPTSILKRPPTAELRRDQTDQDTLPPYSLLDRFLELYVEKDMSIEAAVRRGIPKAIAIKTARMVDRNEYKRRQSPPGIKITPKAFGRDRRMPITNRYRL